MKRPKILGSDAPMTTHPPSAFRDPRPALAAAIEAWGGRDDLWVFGYASLIWRPEFESVEDRPARVYGWHRSLAMRSRINRGTPECPGLVFALVAGGVFATMGDRAWLRAFGWVYAPLVVVVTVATANHLLFDAVAAAVVVGCAYASAARRTRETALRPVAR